MYLGPGRVLHACACIMMEFHSVMWNSDLFNDNAVMSWWHHSFNHVKQWSVWCQCHDVLLTSFIQSCETVICLVSMPWCHDVMMTSSVPTFLRGQPRDTQQQNQEQILLWTSELYIRLLFWRCFSYHCKVPRLSPFLTFHSFAWLQG